MKPSLHSLRLRFGRPFQNMFRRRACQLLVGCGLALEIMAGTMPAQNLQTPPPNSQEVDSVAQATHTESTSEPSRQKPMPSQPPPTPLRAELVAPKQPRVSYKGGQLTIIAENSELADVLSLLSLGTGAKIDFPPSAAHERIWAEAGPGPARRVVATLLSEINLDYAIQGSETDPQGIRIVLVSIRTNADMGEGPRQEDQALQKPEASTEVASEDLQPAPAGWQPSEDTPELPANELATFSEVAPAEWQNSLDTPCSVSAKYYPFDIVIAADHKKDITEDPRLTVYIGKPLEHDGKPTDIPVNDSGGMRIKIRICAEDKLSRMLSAIFVGDPFRLRHNLEVSSRK
jgi:hypothetical protein